jgi:colanic acid/amylovoran biosynthesis protein
MKKNKYSELPKEICEILIVNVHSAQNAGDFALLIQTIHYLKIAFGKEIIINVLANWPNEQLIKEVSDNVIGSPWWVIKVWDKNKKPRYQILSLIFGTFYAILFRFVPRTLIKKIIPRKWENVFINYKKSDLVVAVSGNQLFSSGKYAWPLPVVGFPIWLAFLFNKNTIVFPQSIGPLDTRVERKIVKHLYSNYVKKLYIRDMESYRLVKILKIKKSNPSFMHDVAFTLPPNKTPRVLTIMDSKGFVAGNNNIGVTIISKMPSYLSQNIMSNYYKSMSDAIVHLSTKLNFHIFLFCQVYGPTPDENDFIGIERVIDTIGDQMNNKIHYINRELQPSELKACYGMMDLFVASRLHSGIFSLAMFVPTLFIGYLHKTVGVLEAIHLNDYHIDLKNVDKENLLEKVIDMWSNRFILSKTLHNEIAIIEKQLFEFPDEIRRAALTDDH